MSVDKNNLLEYMNKLINDLLAGQNDTFYSIKLECEDTKKENDQKIEWIKHLITQNYNIEGAIRILTNLITRIESGDFDG